MNPHDEIRHITEGASPNEKVYGMGTVHFLAHSKMPAAFAIARAREVLIAWLNVPASAFEDLDHLRRALPPFFVDGFRAETTQEQDDAYLARWRSGNEEQKKRLEENRGWSLSEWMHWMKPENRTWWWWDAFVVSNGHCTVAVAVNEWPFPWEALKGLLINCGFDQVEPEKNT